MEGREGGGRQGREGGEGKRGEGREGGREGRKKGRLFTVVVVVFVDGSPISSPVGPRKQDSTTSSNSVLNVRKGRGLALPVSAVYAPPQTRQTNNKLSICLLAFRSSMLHLYTMLFLSTSCVIALSAVEGV